MEQIWRLAGELLTGLRNILVLDNHLEHYRRWSVGCVDVIGNTEVHNYAPWHVHAEGCQH